MHDYLRCTDLTHLPQQVLDLYQSGPPQPVMMAM
jgi:hypothetical protein